MRPSDRPVWVSVLLSVVAALFGAAPSHAQNLVVNGDFDANVSGWTPSPFNVWDEADHEEAPDSGSLLIRNTVVNPQASVGAFQCVAVTPGIPYDVGASFLIPSGQGSTGAAYLAIVWNSSPDCNGITATTGTVTEEVTDLDVWQERSLRHLVAPAGSAGARIILWVFKANENGALSAHVDGVFLLSAASKPNLLANPVFSANLNGWQPSGVFTAAWEGDFGIGAPGSARCTATGAAPIGSICLSQCLPVQAGKVYDFGASFARSASSTVLGTAGASLSWFTSPDCSFLPIASVAIDEIPPVEGFDRDFTNVSKVGISAPAGAASARLLLTQTLSGAGVFEILWDDAFLRSSACEPGDTVLCLNQGRFRVEAAWETAEGSDAAHAVALTSDTGYFWFFNAANVEVIVKVLDACDPFERYWVFASGLTNVGVVITVTDTQTGAQRTYENPLSRPFLPILDASAFATCP